MTNTINSALETPASLNIDKETGKSEVQTMSTTDHSVSIMPYVKGAVLDLLFEPTDSEDSEGIPLTAVIRDAFLPFTKSQVLLVDLPCPPDGLPNTVILKLYDRRYTNDRKEWGQPWTPERELAAIKLWREIDAGTLDDEACWDRAEGTKDYDERMWEEFFEEMVDDYYRTERRAYERLRELQGTLIPRYFGGADTRFAVDGISETHHVVWGHLFEYLPGITLENIPNPEVLRQHRPAIATLFRDVARLHPLGVIHNDLRAGNIMVQLAANVPRFMIFDFGRAILRPDEPRNELFDEMVWTDINRLRWALNGTKVRDISPMTGPRPDGILSDSLLGELRTQQGWLDRWYTPTDPPEEAAADDAALGRTNRWYRLRPEVERWFWSRHNHTFEYWMLPRPGSPDWMEDSAGDKRSSEKSDDPIPNV